MASRQLVLIDYKTGKRTPDPSGDRQLSSYGLWAFEEFKESEICLTFEDLRERCRLSSQLKRDQASAIKDRIRRSINRVAVAEDFPAKPTPLCQWCGFAPLCSDAHPSVPQAVRYSDVSLDEIKVPDVCPECGEPLVEKLGKFGKFLGCSEFPDCRYTIDIGGRIFGAPTVEIGCGVEEFWVGECSLSEPDYRLVSAWADELLWEKEEVLSELLSEKTQYPMSQRDPQTRIEEGRFKSLAINGDEFPIESFPSIKGLTVETLVVKRCLAEVDLSSFPLLKTLCIASSDLVKLDLSSVPRLRDLDCSCNEIVELDLEPVAELVKLNVSGCPLEKLDLSAVRYLRELITSYGKVQNLDLSVVPSLEKLFVINFPLSEVDLSPVPKLTILCLNGCPIEGLDVSMLHDLRELFIQETNISHLDLKSNQRLELISCGKGKLERLDLSEMGSLREIECIGSPLITLDIRRAPALSGLGYDADQTRLVKLENQILKALPSKNFYRVIRLSHVSGADRDDSGIEAEKGESAIQSDFGGAQSDWYERMKRSWEMNDFQMVAFLTGVILMILSGLYLLFGPD